MHPRPDESKQSHEDRDQNGPNVKTAASTTTIGTKPKRTADEQEILDLVERSQGAEFVELHAELILRQAREFGDL